MKLDYTFDKRILLERQESREAALEEGYTKGKILAYYDMNLSTEEIAVKLNLTEDMVQTVIQEEQEQE